MLAKRLFWWTDDIDDSEEVLMNVCSEDIPDCYTADIPTLSSDGMIKYYIQAIDYTGRLETLPIAGYFSFNVVGGIPAEQGDINTDGTIKSYSTDDVRQVFQECRSSSGTADFTADTVLTDNQFSLSGLVVNGSNTTAVTGVNTKFTQQLKKGDVIVFPSGASRIVSSVTTDTALVLTANGPDEKGKCLRQRARIMEAEKTVAISPTPKNFVKSVTGNQVTLRQQTLLTFSGATVSSSAVGSDSNLIAEDNNDYLITVHENGSTDNSTEGQTINIAQSASTIIVDTETNGTFTVTHGQAAALDADDVIKATYAIQKNIANDNATKTLNRSRGVTVTSTANATATGTASVSYTHMTLPTNREV